MNVYKYMICIHLALRHLWCFHFHIRHYVHASQLYKDCMYVNVTLLLLYMKNWDKGYCVYTLLYLHYKYICQLCVPLYH